MLRRAEGQGVDAHLARARPLLAAGVIPNALQVRRPGGQMPDRVAGDQDGRASGLVDSLVQGAPDLGGRPASIGEGPARVGDLSAHLRAPASKQIEGRVVVLDQFVAPVDEPLDVGADALQRLGHAGVKYPARLAIDREPVVAQQPRLRQRFGGQQRSEPDAWPAAARTDFRGQPRHIGEARVAHVPGGTVGQPAPLPARVHHRVRPVGRVRR